VQARGSGKEAGLSRILFTKKNKDTSMPGNTLAALANSINSRAIGVMLAYLYSVI